MSHLAGTPAPIAASRPGSWAVHWSVIQALVYRDLKARYARAGLGWSWIVIQPVVQMAVFAVLRTALGIAEPGGMSLVIFLYSALLPWNFLTSSISNASPSIFGNASLIRKMAVAREVFPLSAVAAALVDFCVGLAVLAVLMACFAVPVTWNLLWLPALIGMAILLSVSIGLLVAAVAPFRGDVHLAIPHLVQMWMFLTPLFYSTDRVPSGLRTFLALNPATGLVEGFRNVIGGTPPELLPLGWTVLFSLVLLALGWPVFRHMSRFFADAL
jgi:lipopolysaccharide transport system permease protein